MLRTGFFAAAGAGGGAALWPEFLWVASDVVAHDTRSDAAGTITWNALPLGPAAPGRQVIVSLTGQRGSATTQRLSEATLNGVPMKKIIDWAHKNAPGTGGGDDFVIGTYAIDESVLESAELVWKIVTVDGNQAVQNASAMVYHARNLDLEAAVENEGSLGLNNNSSEQRGGTGGPSSGLFIFQSGMYHVGGGRHEQGSEITQWEPIPTTTANKGGLSVSLNPRYGGVIHGKYVNTGGTSYNNIWAWCNIPGKAYVPKTGCVAAVSTSDGQITQMPPHQAGDLIVCFAFRHNSTTPPGQGATGWTNIENAGGNSCAFNMAYKVAQSSNEQVGTWSNSSGMAIVVYRGGYTIAVLRSRVSYGSTGGGQMGYQDTSHVNGGIRLHFVGLRSSTQQGAFLPPPGLACYTSAEQAGSCSMAAHTKDEGEDYVGSGSVIFVDQGRTGTTGYHSVQLEVF